MICFYVLLETIYLLVSGVTCFSSEDVGVMKEDWFGLAESTTLEA